MKIKNILKINTIMPLYFSGGILLYWLIDLIFINDGTLKSTIILQIFLLSFVYTLTHRITYSESIFKNTSVLIRLAIHTVVNFSIVQIFAYTLNWIPEMNIKTFLIFTGIYTFAGIVILIGFKVNQVVLKNELNKNLNQFKGSNDKE